MPVDVQRRRALALGAWAAAVAAGGSARVLAGGRATRAAGTAAGGTGAPGSTTAATPPPTPGAAPASGGPGAVAAVAGPAAAPAPAAAGGPPPALEGDALALHVARRASFGPTPALLEELRSGGVDAWIERQLRPWDLDDGLVEEDLRRLPALEWTPKHLADQRRPGGESTREVRLAAVVRAVRSERQLFEVLVDLWHDFLCTSVTKHPVELFTTLEDRAAIRPHALGRFADLLTAVTLGPAMLCFLDTTSSAAPEVNENHGRELLELHTVGIDGGYGEADVLGAARVLSGWHVIWQTFEVSFGPGLHDASPATVLGWSTPGRGGPEAAGDAPALLEHLARQPATAHRVATVLVQRFVADAAPPDLVASAADVYLSSDTDIAATVHHILTSAWFRSGGAPITRRPFDLVAAMLRATDAAVDLGGAASSLEQTLATLGQPLFQAPSPAGWPVAGSEWVSPNALHRRWSAAAELAHQRLAGISVDHAALTGDTTTVGAVVDALAQRLYGHAASAATRAGAVAVLGNGTDEGSPYPAERVPLVLTFLLSAPEMQLR